MDIEQISGLDELLQLNVIEVILIRLDCKNDYVYRVSTIKTMNWYCMPNPSTRLGKFGAFSSFEHPVGCRQI
jgi:hypothetical protein